MNTYKNLYNKTESQEVSKRIPLPLPMQESCQKRLCVAAIHIMNGILYGEREDVSHGMDLMQEMMACNANHKDNPCSEACEHDCFMALLPAQLEDIEKSSASGR